MKTVHNVRASRRHCELRATGNVTPLATHFLYRRTSDSPLLSRTANECGRQPPPPPPARHKSPMRPKRSDGRLPRLSA